MENPASQSERSRSASPVADQSSAFKARIAQFKYFPLRDVEVTKRFSLSQKTIPAAGGDDADSIKMEEELDSELVMHDNTSTPPELKKRRSTTKERSAQDPYSPINNLVDSLRPGLTLVCIGLNPGLMTASTGHAYAHPSNRFWHLLHASGVTPKKHIPSETRDLMDMYHIGNTNICARPTRSGDGLSKQEMAEGALILEKKIARYKPEAVVIVGKGIWETIWMVKKGQKKFNNTNFRWGWQDEDMQLGRTWEDGQLAWPGAKTFVTTSTSGLAATLTPAEKLAIWKPLGDWMTAKRKQAESARDG